VVAFHEAATLALAGSDAMFDDYEADSLGSPDGRSSNSKPSQSPSAAFAAQILDAMPPYFDSVPVGGCSTGCLITCTVGVCRPPQAACFGAVCLPIIVLLGLYNGQFPGGAARACPTSTLSIPAASEKNIVKAFACISHCRRQPTCTNPSHCFRAVASAVANAPPAGAERVLPGAARPDQGGHPRHRAALPNTGTSPSGVGS
jgi:hypothetical protein